MEACRRLDLHVPDDVAIIGVDNDPLCDMSTPTLSSIQQGTHEIGWRAAETLDKLMRGRRTKKLRVVPPTGVVPRQSTNLLTNSDEMVIAAQQFIRDHANSPIQVADIVEHVGAPRITLDRRFKKALECTVHEELTRFRVECVQTMLRDTNLSIAAIARRMGFSSAQYLNAAFKSYCDMTPGEYRSRHC
jgi:LacI family transcriptional regulator